MKKTNVFIKWLKINKPKLIIIRNRKIKSKLNNVKAKHCIIDKLIL